MSEATEPTRKLPAAPAPITVTDSLGRVLTIKRLDALAELDLIEAAGSGAENRRWMVMATLTACVDLIDGAPAILLTNRETIRSRVRQVGSEGIAAVLQALAPDEKEAAENETAAADASKN